MRTLHPIVLLCTFVCSVIVSHVFAAVPELRFGINISSTSNEVEQIIGVTNQFFIVGENIDLTETLENLSTNEIVLLDRDGLMDYSFTIQEPGGRPARLTQFGGRMLHPVNLYHQSTFTLSPAKSKTEIITLNKIFVMTNQGEYQVTVTRKLTDTASISTGPFKVALTNATNSRAVK